MRAISHLHNRPVLEKGDVKVGQTYLVGLRLHLDLSQMPKTFQVSALANKDWNLSSDWLRWGFSPAEVTPPPAGSGPVAPPAPVVPAAPAAAAAGEGK